MNFPLLEVINGLTIISLKCGFLRIVIICFFIAKVNCRNVQNALSLFYVMNHVCICFVM